MKHTGLIITIAIVLVSDGIALIETAHNRAGNAVQTIQLTERELPRLNSDLENTGVDLNLNWSQFSSTGAAAPLDRTQLEAAGFVFKDAPSEATRDYAFLPREAFVALEYEGQKWREWQQLGEEAKQFRRTADPPHLFVVDASKSVSALRGRYPDQSKYLIVRAVIMARTQAIKDAVSNEVTRYEYGGRVVQIRPDVIHVPLPLSSVISSLKRRSEGGEPRYTVTVKYGRNLEPWVAAVNLR